MAKKKGRDHKQRGATLGLGICSFFAMIFESNEEAPKRKKLTDEQIEEEVRKEYPNKQGQFFSGRKKVPTPNWGKISVSTYRQKYNKGVFTRNVPPERYSFRYNKQGLAVDSRTGKRVLLPEEIKAASLRHQQDRKKVLRALAHG